MGDHLAKRLAVRFGQLVQSAHPRPVDVAPYPHRGFLRPLPLVFAQGLFGHFLEDVRVPVWQVGLGLQRRVDGTVGRRQPGLVHHPAQHQVAAHFPEPQLMWMRHAAVV